MKVQKETDDKERSKELIINWKEKMLWLFIGRRYRK